MLGEIRMSVTNEFRKAVLEKNVDLLHIMMSNSLVLDPTFEEFEEMEKVARDVPGLYVKYDGKMLENDSSKWNNDYLHWIDTELVYNFSHERVDHIKKVIRYLHPVKSKQMPKENEQNKEKNNQKNSYQEQKRQDQLDGRIIKIVSGAAVGGVAGGVISGVAGGSVVAGAVVGAVVVGGVVALATK